jgi:23S rRNA pseudouridine1911/1915/1917 synthase
MQLTETHNVPKLENPIRFQEYGVGIFNTIPTKSGIKKAIKKELIFIDGNLASTSKYISGEEKIELFQSEKSSIFKRLELKLEVLFEDDYLAIIYKPAGILVSGNKFITIANGLTQNLKKSKQFDAVKPQPVHRLDYPTSGLLLVGKTSTAIIELGKLFQNKEIKKTYFAITIGAMNTVGLINFLIDEKNSANKVRSSKNSSFKTFCVLKPRKVNTKNRQKASAEKACV